MKDLQLEDILNRKDKPLTRLSVYYNGRWSFATLENPTRTTSDQNFYLVSSPFGLIREGVTNPSKYAVKGKAGEYVSVDKQGRLALVRSDLWALLFPKNQQIPTAPPSSELLRNKNFLTKTLQESVDKDSDKVLIGDRTFSLPSTQKKTLTIVETPLGQTKVYSDTAGAGMVYNYDLSAMVETDIPDKPY